MKLPTALNASRQDEDLVVNLFHAEIQEETSELEFPIPTSTFGILGILSPREMNCVEETQIHTFELNRVNNYIKCGWRGVGCVRVREIKTIKKFMLVD